MNRTTSLVWSIGEIVVAVFLVLFAAVLVIVGIGFASDASRAAESDWGKGIFCWLMAIAMAVIAVVLYRRSISRLSATPRTWSIAEIGVSLFLLFCAGVGGILGFAAAEGGPHAFPADTGLAITFSVVALALAAIGSVLLWRSIQRLRSTRAQRLADPNYAPIDPRKR